MAKSLRATRTKNNNARLRAKVFGPAELARTKRLSEKLAAIASAPKPEREQRMISLLKLWKLTASAEPKKESEDTQGASRSFSVVIPQEFSASQMPLTPPPPPPPRDIEDESLFFHMLGVAGEIDCFDEHGNLVLDFGATIPSQ